MVWSSAGANIGEAEPAGVVGDSGFVYYSDGTVDFWAVRSAAGIFAVGAGPPPPGSAPQPPDPDDSADNPPTPVPAPRMCGVGLIPAGLLGLAGLLQLKRRHHRP